MIVYGIPNCNTVKKAIDWLKANDIPFEFHDYKKKGISPEKLKQWADGHGWEALLNRKGTTWRQLPDEIKLSVDNEEAALELMREKTSVIKRPVIEHGDLFLIGFDEEVYASQLKSKA